MGRYGALAGGRLRLPLVLVAVLAMAWPGGPAIASVSHLMSRHPTRAGVHANPPGVGAAWSRSLAGHNQVIVANGTNNWTNGRVRMTMWTWSSTGWHKGGSYWAWGGGKGWGKTRQGDVRSPTGVYSLTDAGGYYRNPGTSLRYTHSARGYSRVIQGHRVFSYVISIGYNHVAGTSPLSTRTVSGRSMGDQVWIHEGHNGYSLGCLGTSRAGVLAMLRWVNPASRPVILMGPGTQISRRR